jgi:hypothetical protein
VSKDLPEMARGIQVFRKRLFLSFGQGALRKINVTLQCRVNIKMADPSLPPEILAKAAQFIRDSLPQGGLFAGLDWRISPAPFPLGENLAKEIESLGRVLLQFYRAVNLLYRKSAEGKQPKWVARWLDLGNGQVRS